MALGDVKFVTTGPWGAGIARPLTASEADGNINELKAAIQNIIDNPVDGVSITNIAVVGRQLTFYMSDATTFGPFDLPISVPEFRGVWAITTDYAAFNIVTNQDYGTYLVLVDHTSNGTAFDPFELSLTGDQLYQQIAPPTTEQTIEITADVFTPDETHVNTFLLFTNIAGCTVTLGSLPANAQFTVRQCTDFPVTFVSSGSPIIEGVIGYDAATGGRGSVVTCKYFGNSWYIFGRLAEAP